MLPALCATQITSWGVLYYAFPNLRSAITAETGWSATVTTAAFSAALLTSAAVGIPLGRVLDRNGPRAVMTGGSVLASLSLLAVAAAPTLPLFVAAWFAAGTAMAATFYQPAFAAVTRWWGESRVKALTAVTLTGGLASTVFSPLTALLVGPLGWRGTYVVLALVLALITIPAHALALRAPWPPLPESTDSTARKPEEHIARSRPFVLLTCAMTLSGFTIWAVLIAMVPLMIERGASVTTAAWALGLCGVGQAVGRACYAAVARRTTVATRTCLLIGAGGVSTALLGLVRGPIWLLLVLAAFAGIVRGNLTLLQATAVSDRWGIAAYGRLSALLAAPVTVTSALTPFITAALAPLLGGYPRLFLLLAGVSVLSMLFAMATGARRPTAPSTGTSGSGGR
ncbi:MFS transporter [Streptomyces sp. NPDC088729]|uniref:MFS transporter n=1 Tax=Streptomyces sp. NPDC088729 TaxID=3365876 RepID=UPI003804386E